jgi:hypothetical protein
MPQVEREGLKDGERWMLEDPTVGGRISGNQNSTNQNKANIVECLIEHSANHFNNILKTVKDV